MAELTTGARDATDQLRELVRERYAGAAKAAADTPQSGCCGAAAHRRKHVGGAQLRVRRCPLRPSQSRGRNRGRGQRLAGMRRADRRR